MLVSYKKAQPQKLPKSLEDKTEEELVQLGFYLCPEAPSLIPGQKLWWENNSWVVLEPNEAEVEIQWQAVKNQAEDKLAKTDYKVIKAYEKGEALSTEWLTYRQALRNIYNNVEAINPFDVNWPNLPSEQGVTYEEPIEVNP